MNKIQVFRVGIAAACAFALLAGCGRDDGDGGAGGAAGSGETPEPGGVAIIAEGADMTIPYTLLAGGLLSGDLAGDVMNVALTRGAWRDGELVHLLADESPVAAARRVDYVGADSAALLFRMRSDLRWSDGRPLTARDFALTYQLLRDPELGSARAESVANMDSVVVQDDSTLTFHFKQRNPEMLSDAALPPTPHHLFAETPAAELRNHPVMLDPANGRLPVSGPWMIGRWDKAQQIVLVPNPHFRPQPHLQQIVIRIVPDAVTRTVELQTGAVDAIRNAGTEQLPALRAQSGVRIERERMRGYDFITYNPTRVPAFADPEIRRALTLAIDAKQILQALQLDEFATPAGGPYPPIFELHDPGQTPPPPVDTAQAKRILASKGWRDTDGDGVLDKDGRPFRFTLVTNSGNQRRADIMQIVQQAWRRVGVDVELRTLEFNTFMQNLLGHQYEAALAGWSVGLSPSFIATTFQTGAPYNTAAYSNPRVDALIEQARAQPTEEAARPLWQQAAALIARDQPYTWLYYMDMLDPVRDRLKGLHVDTYGFYQNTWEWWIPRSQQRGAGPTPATGDSARRDSTR